MYMIDQIPRTRYTTTLGTVKSPTLTLSSVDRFTDPLGRVVKTIFRGRLVDDYGMPIAYGVVYAVGYLNGWNQQLGNARTNAAGFYEIKSIVNLEGGSVKTVYHGYADGEPVPETSSEMQTLPPIKRS